MSLQKQLIVTWWLVRLRKYRYCIIQLANLSSTTALTVATYLNLHHYIMNIQYLRVISRQG